MKFRIIKEVEAKNLKEAIKNEPKADIKTIDTVEEPEIKSVGY